MSKHSDELITSGECAIIYMIDPPHLVSQSIPLLLSLRKAYPTARIIPYMPMGTSGSLPSRVAEFHARLDATPRELTRELNFNRKRYNKPYKHGHKILAAAEKREGAYCIFVDTDTYLAKPFDDPRLCQPDAVAVVPESVAGFSGRFIEVWDATYAVFGLKTPEERVKMQRTGQERPPYFNAGFIAFPEVTPSGDRFGELWYDTAMTFDYEDTVDHERKRPWLDQATLPVASLRGGLRHEVMENDFNYPVDAEFLPKPSVRLYHYHGLERLRAAEHTSELESLLTKDGLFQSLDHYEAPLTKLRAAMRPLSQEVGKLAEERRGLKAVSKGEEVSETMSQREAKQAIQAIQKKERAVREELSTMHEAQFYDDDWLRFDG